MFAPHIRLRPIVAVDNEHIGEKTAEMAISPLSLQTPETVGLSTLT